MEMSEKPVLVARGLTKSFGAVHAVRNVSLDLNPGEIYGLVGPDGAGKTTLLRLLCGVLSLSGGTVTVGVDDTELATAHVPQAILILGSTGVDIGRGPVTAVVDDLDGPSPLTIPLHRVTFELGDNHPPAEHARAQAELARE